MLKLLDENKKQIALLKYVEDYRIESSLKTGNKTLTFYYSKDNEFYDYIKEESYIKTKTDEFIIKARSTEEEETSFICELNLENLEGVPFDRFESIEQPITAALNLAIVGTGWTVKENNINKKRTVRMTDCSSLDIVQEIIKVYRVDIVFDTLNKQIKVYNELGSDKGTYLIEDLNLKKLGIQSDSYNYATRIKARGKDGLTFASINGGKDYVENYQYTKKIKTIFWSDDRYTIKESLLEDAKEKLNEISKPLVSYAATIKNLALLNPIYKNILDYSLGDIITLISKSNKLKDKQRIVKIIEYPMDHSRDTVELANSTLSFEDLQTEFQDTTDTVNNITTDNGTVDGSTVDGITTKQIEDFEANVIKVTNLKAVYAEIETLKVGKADIQNLNAVTARIGTLESTKANITDLTSTNIKVANLEANKATITDLNAASGKICVLESKTASIDNLLAGNLTANNFKANSIVAGSGIIADGAIGDAQISSLNANKMRAGTLDTSLVTVCGPQGRLKILGNKLQIFDDVNNKLFERIMLGINENNRASLTLRGADGQTVLLTEEGLTKAGITDGFNKADDNSLNASKFDKNSIVRQVNGATESINGTRVQVGDRSLDIELSTQKNTITNNSKELSSQKATILALDNSIKLKVDTQTYTNSINAINNNISTTNSNLSKATTELNLLKNEVSSKVSQSEIDKTITNVSDAIKSTNEKISTVESNLTQKTNGIEAGVRDLNSITKTLNTKVTSLDSQVNVVNNKVHNVESNFNILNNQISTKVSQSDIDKSIKNLELGSRNLILDSFINQTSNLYGFGSRELSLPLKSNTTYTFTVNGRSNTSGNTQGKHLRCYVYETSWQYGSWNFPIEDTNDTTKYITFTTGVIPDGKNFKVSFYWYPSQGDRTGNATVNWCTLIEGNKNYNDWMPAPEDTGKLVADSITVVDSKIDNVSSELTQAKNSLQASINSVSSKTNSIETTLNGKATKQEVYSVDSKVSSIKASLDSINQRVSSTEVKTQTLENTINGKASKQELINTTNKVVSLENNLNGITNRVSSTESRINSVDGKVNNCATKSEFTELKQSVDSFTYKIEKQGNENICTNSGFESNDKNIFKAKSEACSNAYVTGKVNNVIPKDGGNFLFIESDSDGGDTYVLTTLSFMFEDGETYTISADARYATLGNITSSSCYIEYWGNYSQIFSDDKFNNHGYIANWHRVSTTWTAPKGHGAGRAFIRFGFRADKYSWGAWDNVKVEKGRYATGYTSTGNSIYGSTVTIDTNELRCAYEDGSYSKMERNGFEWWKSGMKHPYHCLMARGSVDKVNSGQTVRILLPEVFRGKDYELGWWTGNVFPANPTDCLFAVNTELTRQNKNEGWFEVKMSVMVRNPNKESNPQWRGKANVVWIAIA